MSYREGLVQEDSWGAFEEALDEAVSGYVQGLSALLEEDYEDVDVEILEDYSIELEASDGEIRAYNIHLPDLVEPMLVDVERSVDQSSNAGDEERETVAYHFIPRSEEDMKFRNIRSEFQRVTRPDSVEGNVSLFYRSGDAEPLAQVSSWGFFDDNNLMEGAIEKYEDNYPAEADFDVRLMADSGKDWRIYEFDFEDIEEPMHLEITLHGNTLSTNWKQDEHRQRYRNFLEFGFSKAVDELTD